MSSYGSGGGPWDGGPPGAEAEYATQRPPQPYAQSQYPPHTMPTTDPWTGVSYSQYSQPANYDYSTYNANSYRFNYDSNYYQGSGGNYMNYANNAPAAYPPSSLNNYSYPPQSRSRSPITSRSYEDRRRPYKSNSRSVSPYEKKGRAYSNKRDSSYEEERRGRSRSKTRKSKRYSSDRSSSPSLSSSHLSSKKEKKNRSLSSNSSDFGKSYRDSRAHDSSMTPPLKRSPSLHRSKSRKISSEERSRSKSPRSYKDEKDKLKGKDVKSYSFKKISNDKKQRDGSTPPRKKKDASPPKGLKKVDKSVVKIERSSLTPPRSYQRRKSSDTPLRNKYKDRNFETPPRKERENTLTPPKSYTKKRSSSTSRSRTRSPTPKRSNRKHSHSLKTRHSRSVSSSCSSVSSRRSLSTSKSRRRKSVSKSMSRSRSRSKRRSMSKSRSKSRRRSKSKGRNRHSKTSRGKSRSSSSRSKSRSDTPSEDERRGQFTVADRKRYWKINRRKQEEREKERKSPLKELKPPPGAIEPTVADEIQYGDPPEVEGPNFAELLSPPDQTLFHAPSSSKSKTIPIPIKNDGSFLEMFKKMQEETKKAEVEEKKPEIKKPVLPFIGKRRGGRVLKTGLVKKAKAIDEQTADSTPKDAWSLYMQEVKKYRETSCEEERKTRPLVK